MLVANGGDGFALENMPIERWFIHVDPLSGDVVACHGVEMT